METPSVSGDEGVESEEEKESGLEILVSGKSLEEVGVYNITLVYI